MSTVESRKTGKDNRRQELGIEETRMGKRRTFPHLFGKREKENKEKQGGMTGTGEEERRERKETRR